LITPFDIFINRKSTDLQLVSHSSTSYTWRGTRNVIFRSVNVYNKKISSPCHLNSQIEQLQDTEQSHCID